MKKYALVVFSFQLFVFITFDAFSQNGKEKRLSKKADRYFIVANYGKSIPAYKGLLEINPTGFGYNYKLGVSYFYSSNASDKLKAVPYFETALRNMKDTMPEIYYYLGQTCQIANRFDDAINYYNILKVYVGQSQSAIKEIEEIDNYIDQCKNAKQLMKIPIPVKITNLGNNINSDAADYAPVISADESILILTSKRKGTTGGKIDDDGKFYEDIYISKKISDKGDWQASTPLDNGDSKLHLLKMLFSKAEKISKAINTRDHDASIALSPNGKTLFIYRNNDVWQSESSGDKWSRPQRLPENVNSKKYHEPSVSQSADGNTLYVVSERPGGFGGKDLYKSTKQTDGSWGVLENLGATINTPFNEDGPFIHSDGKTLFFSSEGHKGMGGYDIYKSLLTDKTWGTPINIGYPINSAADDIFLTMNAKGNHAYYSSIKEDNFGDLDIYIITPMDIPNANQNLTAYLGVDSGMFALALMSNNATATKSGKVLSITKFNDLPYNSSIKITNAKLSSDTANYISALGTGKQMINLPSGEKYVLTLEASGYPTHTVEIDVPLKNEERNYYQEILFEDIKDAKANVIGRKTSVYTAVLNLDSAIATNPNYASMPKEEAYAAWLKANRNSPSVKTSSFTDYIDASVAVKTPTTTPVESKDIPVFQPILFDFAKALLRAESTKELDDILKYISENKNVKLEIYGHTDSKGSDQFNMGLSQRRSGIAKKYFMDKGISNNRIKSAGKGETQPIAPNENPDKSDNPEGRQLNRRVEFRIVTISK